MKGTTLEEKVQNWKRKCTKIRNETLFREQTRNTFSYFFQFRETIETRRASDLFQP